MWTRWLERLTGTTAMDRIYADAAARTDGADIFAAVRDRLGLRPRPHGAAGGRIPATGPVVVVANHPSGFAEGLVVPALAAAVRADVMALAHRWFARWPRLAHRMFLMDPQDARAAGNGAASRAAVRHLRAGGCLVLFPAGEVASGDAGRPLCGERPWRDGLGQLVRLTGATVVPVHVAGRNGRVYRTLTRLHPRLGACWLGREVLRRRGGTVAVCVGAPLAGDDLRRLGSVAAITARCREAVARLADLPTPCAGVAGHPAGDRLCSGPVMADRTPSPEPAEGTP